MLKLRKALLKAGDTNKLSFEALKEERQPVFSGGVAVLLGVFRALGIEHMGISDEAMREGLLYDLLGRIQQEDVRARTVDALCSRCSVETEQASRVRSTALRLLENVRESWGLCGPQYAEMLGWATQLPAIRIDPSYSCLSVMFPDGWLDDNPLTSADLEQEAQYVKEAEFELAFS